MSKPSADVIAWSTAPQQPGVRNPDQYYVIECTLCGLIGVSQATFVRGDCANHLRHVHKVRNII